MNITGLSIFGTEKLLPPKFSKFPSFSVSSLDHHITQKMSLLRPIARISLPRASQRFFSVRSFVLNDKKDSLDFEGVSDPNEILSIGFRRMREVQGYEKSEQEIAPLLKAAQKLGISESKLREIYDNTDIHSATVDPSLSTGYEPGSDAERLYLLNTLNVNQPIQEAHRPFKYDDIPALGHLQLRNHRVQRQYNRIAAYELPQLSQFAQPYRKRTEKQAVRLRYTTYFGEQHPAESKVVASFKTSDLKDLTEAQRHKLRLLAGVRYDHETDVVKISATAFSEAAQNVTYIGEILRNLLKEAKDSKDTFADIPLRTSHVEARKRRNKNAYRKFEYPENWKRPEDAPKPKDDILTKLAEKYIDIPNL